jgi:hypothetical protein
MKAGRPTPTIREAMCFRLCCQEERLIGRSQGPRLRFGDLKQKKEAKQPHEGFASNTCVGIDSQPSRRTDLYFKITKRFVYICECNLNLPLWRKQPCTLYIQRSRAGKKTKEVVIAKGDGDGYRRERKAIADESRADYTGLASDERSLDANVHRR